MTDGRTDRHMDGWGGTFLFTCNCRRSVTHGRLKVPNLSAMDSFFWADVKSAKEIDCTQLVHKVLLRFFPPVCPLPPLFFTLCYLIMSRVHVMHVLDMLCVLGVHHNMSLGMLCGLWNIHNMEGL